MKIINIEAKTFESMMERFDAFARKIDAICKKHGDKSLQKWMDNQDVCMILNISKRSLQTYRDNGTLPYTQIGHKMYYKLEDVKQLLSVLHYPKRERKTTEKIEAL